MTMKILFVSLPNPPLLGINRDYCGGFGSAYPISPGAKLTVFPPIFDAYAAAMLLKQGFDVSIIDAQAEDLSVNQLLQKIKRVNPTVVVARISLPAFDNDVKILGEIKNVVQDAVLIGWGSVCKVEPEHVLSRSNLNLVIRGELEFIILEVAKKLKENESLNSINGISFKNKGAIIHNPDRPFEKNLDAIPFPAYHLLPMEKYLAPEAYFVPNGSKTKMISFFTMLSSRGCSMNCLYCPYPVIFGPWRGFSPERVVAEIEELTTNYPIQAIWFHDQTFSMFPKQTEELCDEITKRGIDIRWACETRADKLSSSLVRKMKAAGCTRIQIGVETGDTDLLERIGKRSTTLEVIEKAIEVFKKENMLVEANFLVGLPGESWKTIVNTARFIKKIKPDDVAVSIVTPYPGTPLFKLAKRKGWLITEDWSNYSTSKPVMSYPDFSAKEMKAAQLYLALTANSVLARDKMRKALNDHQPFFALKLMIKNLPEFAFTFYLDVRYAKRPLLT